MHIHMHEQLYSYRIASFDLHHAAVQMHAVLGKAHYSVVAARLILVHLS